MQEWLPNVIPLFFPYLRLGAMHFGDGTDGGRDADRCGTLVKVSRCRFLGLIYFDQLPQPANAIPFVGEAPPGYSPLGRREDSRCTDLFRGHRLGLTDVILRSSRDGEPFPLPASQWHCVMPRLTLSEMVLVPDLRLPNSVGDWFPGCS